MKEKMEIVEKSEKMKCENILGICLIAYISWLRIAIWRILP
jgi:hypothetical protein